MQGDNNYRQYFLLQPLGGVYWCTWRRENYLLLFLYRLVV